MSVKFAARTEDEVNSQSNLNAEGIESSFHRYFLP